MLFKLYCFPHFICFDTYYPFFFFFFVLLNVYTCIFIYMYMYGFVCAFSLENIYYCFHI